MSHKYILISEAALDVTLSESGLTASRFLPKVGGTIHEVKLTENITGYRCTTEPENPYYVLIRTSCIEELFQNETDANNGYRRIARVIKSFRAPPVHLPRQWSEYHYKNLIAFFALPRESSSARWITELSSRLSCAKFDFLYLESTEIQLSDFTPVDWPLEIEEAIGSLKVQRYPTKDKKSQSALVAEVDLAAIGSSAVVHNRTFEVWETSLTTQQRAVLTSSADTSIRIVGPAGSGKTLSLCMRALQISRDPKVTSQGKTLLIVTHSWAMTERIDGVLETLNGGLPPSGITVFPLLSLLEFHAGHIGQQKTEIIGADSTEGRIKSIELIQEAVSNISVDSFPGISKWISEALRAASDSRLRLDLTINIYDEISGVLSASGVSPDDPDSIRKYVGSIREDWMPPFETASDRGFVVLIYRAFIQSLIDRSSITTDQFVLDSIRILETFTWRMRKETEGYDYIFIDELQLFDPQERTAIELLGRSRMGVPFVTAEDPSQGVFAALNARRQKDQIAPVYLDTTHRFNRGIFDLINFIYQKFPLNSVPLRIENAGDTDESKPALLTFGSDEVAIAEAISLATRLQNSCSLNERICIATLGDVDVLLLEGLEKAKLPVVRLQSFDDVEKLAYRKRSIILAPWQFVGGTQFQHVIVVAAAVSAPESQFGKLREMTSVYLACSRAATSLHIICSTYTPSVIWEAAEQHLLEQTHV